MFLVLKNYKFRIYPTKAQVSKLNENLDLCRQLWNLGLEQRNLLWKNRKSHISQYDQNKQLTELKREFPEFKNVFSQVSQNVFERLDLAFQAFFRRLRRREEPGYPRFRGKGRYNSFTYPQGGFKVQNNHVYLSKIGHIPIISHQEVPGKIKRCTVQQSSADKWYVIFSVDEQEPKPAKIIPKSFVGIDVGISSFLTFSDGSKIENPKFFKRDRKALAQVQRRFSKNKTKKNKHSIALVHERIKNRRENFAHQLSRQIINKFDYIAVEDLAINQLKADSHKVLNREISDAAWNSFLQKLEYKAEYAGKQVEKVNPAYTSQDCSGCGYRTSKTLKDRVHKCPNCSLVLDRDHNAALNVLALGLQSLALQGPRSPRL